MQHTRKSQEPRTIGPISKRNFRGSLVRGMLERIGEQTDLTGVLNPRYQNRNEFVASDLPSACEMRGEELARDALGFEGPRDRKALLELWEIGSRKQKIHVLAELEQRGHLQEIRNEVARDLDQEKKSLWQTPLFFVAIITSIYSLMPLLVPMGVRDLIGVGIVCTAILVGFDLKARRTIKELERESRILAQADEMMRMV